MTTIRRALRAALLTLCACMPAALTMAAEEFPTRAVRIVVPYPPGGTTDLLARLYAQKLSEIWGQPVIVDNRAGASGNIGMDSVARSPADGYTLVMVNNAVAINVSLFQTQTFDLVKDFAPLGLVASTPMIMATSRSSPIRNLAQLTAEARARPGAVSFASCGNGTPQHLAVELYLAIEGLSMLHVPYKGCAPAVADLLGNQIQVMATTTSVMVPLIASGKVTPLAQTARLRSTAAPEVPTFAESGIKGYELDIWYGLLGPAAMPKALRDKLSGDLRKVSERKDVRDLLRANGIDERIGNAADMAGVIDADLAKYASLIRKIGLKAE